MAITIGQFLKLRADNPDTPSDPYDPSRESLLEISKPAEPFAPTGPDRLPPPPGVTMSSPEVLPPPPAVSLSNPEQLPPPPGVLLSTAEQLPPPPSVNLSSPDTLPPSPQVTLSSPDVLPPPPPVALASGEVLGPPPPVTLSSPAVLPPPDKVSTTENSVLPPPPEVNIVMSPPPAPVNPVATPGTDYKVFGETYSPVLGGGYPGSLAADPAMYERSVERTMRLPPGKLAEHVLNQTTLFAMNTFGNVWNPALINPPPVEQNFIRPALDLPPEGTESMQIQIGDLVKSALTGDTGKPTDRLSAGDSKKSVQPSLAILKTKSSLAQSFDTANNVLSNGLSVAAGGQVDDPLRATVFDNGIIPMRLKGDNALGFRTFRKDQGDQTDDDDVYMPLSFTDLRPVGDVYRSVYFRPLDLRVAESFSPMWNKAQYFGRVDPVATYQSTGRTFSISWRQVAFGPEDVRTIYQKLHWLSSMVYPTYDSNLAYSSGPVVRMRVGDVVNGLGIEGGKGIPGIIEGLEFDYSDSLWELQKDFKLPRDVSISLSFTVLHDLPMGLGVEGNFGGMGSIDSEGKYIASIKDGTTGKDIVPVDSRSFRKFGGGQQVDYARLADADAEKP